MRRLGSVVLLVGVALVFWRGDASARQPGAEAQVVLYDSNPTHLWNRVYAALLMRQDRRGNVYGRDAVDAPMWSSTEYLLSEPSHQRAVAVLDEFLKSHAESIVHDPVKRAMMQRDLWSVFDWTVQQSSDTKRPRYDGEKQELQIRLAEALRRLALTPDEIKALPDTFAQAVASGAFAKEYDAARPEQAFLPADLFDPRGSWAGISPSPESEGGVAKMHLENSSGRSSFLVFVRLPGGHKATMDYFRTLWDFPQPWLPGPSFASDQAVPNPDLPSFPAGTQVALVRRANLFDTEGNLVASPIVESVQIRVYRAITTAQERDFGDGNMDDVTRHSGQEFYEFKMSRGLLFAGKNGGLRAITRDDKEFPTFGWGDDPIEPTANPPERFRDAPVELKTCISCHSGGGVRSLNSRGALIRPNRMQGESRNSDYGSWGVSSALEWKQNRYDWGLLNGYWKTAPAK